MLSFLSPLLFLAVFPIVVSAGEDLKKLPHTKIKPIFHACAPVKTITTSNAKNAPIPKRLFQTWKTHELPDIFAKWSQTWRKFNPDWEYELWDDAENRAFIKAFYPWFLSCYDAYPKEIYRADSVRYFYLYHYGGIYADLDFECLKSLDPLLKEGCVILGRMSLNDHTNNIPNAFMASPPKSDLWVIVFYLLLNTPNGRGPEDTTGPEILHKAIRFYQNSTLRESILSEMDKLVEGAIPIPIQIRPPCELYPLDWTTKKYIKAPCSYCVTWWTHSWGY